MRIFGYPYYRRVLRQLLSSSVLAGLVLTGIAVPVQACEKLAPLVMDMVAQGVYVHEGVHENVTSDNCGDIANIGFIVGQTSVAVIDPGGSAAVGLALRKAVEAVTPLPISHVVITHFHPDHFFGAEQLGSEVAIVTHKNYSRALVQRGQFYLERYAAIFPGGQRIKLVQPTLQVELQEQINLGGRELRLTAHRTAHTDNDLSVYDVESRVLWTGDLLFNDRLPSIDGSVNGWLDVMDELGQMAPDLVIPGHGPIGRWDAIAPKQRRYLEVVRNELRDIIKNNGRIAQAVDAVGTNERDKWLLFDDVHQGNITRAFTELEWE